MDDVMELVADAVDEAVDEIVAEQEDAEETVEVTRDVASSLDILRALAIRAKLGYTKRLQLVVPGMGVLNDDRYGIVFNDASSEAVDAYIDAVNQYRSVERMEIDEETNLPVGEQSVEQHRRSWPLLDVIINYGIVREADLPIIKDDGSFGVYKWSTTNPAANRKMMKRAKQLTIATLLTMAGDHIMGSEGTGEMMSQLGE